MAKKKAKENKSFMVIERVLCPPGNNPREVIYTGKFLKLEDIKSTLNLVPEKAGNFLYTILNIERRNERIKISSKIIDYNDIERGELYQYKNYYTHSIDLPLDKNVKTGLLKILDTSYSR